MTNIKIGDKVYGEKKIEAGGGKIIGWDKNMRALYDETDKAAYRILDFEGLVVDIKDTILIIRNGAYDSRVRINQVLRVDRC